MRKLAREAVIFMLLTPLLVAAGTFVYFRVTIPINHGIDMSSFRLLDEKEKQNNPSGATGIAEVLPPSPACLDFSSDGNCTNSSFLLMSLIFGLYGFPAGLGLWVFYRTVRFAIKG
jgi:hypothetical protein